MVQMLIAGEREAARSCEEIEVVNPATEEILESVPKREPVFGGAESSRG
jgi:acyl-CoA reductase-like NAD-dependent aldehyde dehydrogenase